MKIPFFDKLDSAEKVLIAGAGGGYDMISGMPLYHYLRALGKEVVLANLSFSQLRWTNNRFVMPNLYEITEKSDHVRYFPEKHLRDWLVKRGECPPPIYALETSGVQKIAAIYRHLIEIHHIDSVILADGGTDSLMFGDEEQVGTIVEDSCSILALYEATKNSDVKTYLSAIGFGVEHDLNHHACLENISTLTRAGDYLGAFSLTQEMPEGKAFIELVNYLNHVGYRSSIVTNNVKAAMQGEFGNFHSVERAKSTEQFISALMNIYWCFNVSGIAERIVFKNEVVKSQTIEEFVEGYTCYRNAHPRRKSQSHLPIT